MKKITLLLLLALPLLALKCKWEPPAPKPETMPPATQEGLRTLGMYVNGELWVAKARGFDAQSSYSEFYQSLGVSGTRKIDSTSALVAFHIPPGSFMGEGDYELGSDDDTTQSNCLYSFSKSPNSGIIDYYSSDSLPGFLNITKFDYEKRFVSGTFNVSVVSADGQDTLHLTDGRFDIPL